MSGGIHQSVNVASRVGHTDLRAGNAEVAAAVVTPRGERVREARLESQPLVPGHHPSKPPMLMYASGRDGAPRPVYMRPVPQDPAASHGPLVVGHTGREKPLVPMQSSPLTGTGQLVHSARPLTGQSAAGDVRRIPPGGTLVAGAKPLTGTGELVGRVAHPGRSLPSTDAMAEPGRPGSLVAAVAPSDAPPDGPEPLRRLPNALALG